MSKTHGLSCYRLGCKCDIGRAANTEHVAEYRAGFACCKVHPGCQCRENPESARRLAAKGPAGKPEQNAAEARERRSPGRGDPVAARSAGQARERRSPAHGDPVPASAVSLPAGDTSASTGTSSGEHARDLISDWTPAVWEDFTGALGLLVSASTEVVKITLAPGLSYDELEELAESWNAVHPEFVIAWVRDTPGSLKIWRVMPVRVPVKSPRKPKLLRYSIKPSARGMCEIQTSLDDSPCSRYAGIAPDDWSFMVSNHPACQRHYEIVSKAYPGICMYRGQLGVWKDAPKGRDMQ